MTLYVFLFPMPEGLCMWTYGLVGTGCLRQAEQVGFINTDETCLRITLLLTAVNPKPNPNL